MTALESNELWTQKLAREELDSDWRRDRCSTQVDQQRGERHSESSWVADTETWLTETGKNISEISRDYQRFER